MVFLLLFGITSAVVVVYYGLNWWKVAGRDVLLSVDCSKKRKPTSCNRVRSYGIESIRSIVSFHLQQQHTHSSTVTITMLLLSIPCSTRLREDGRTLFVPDGGLPERHIHTPQMCKPTPKNWLCWASYVCYGVGGGGFRSWRNTHTYLSRPLNGPIGLKNIQLPHMTGFPFKHFDRQILMGSEKTRWPVNEFNQTRCGRTMCVRWPYIGQCVRTLGRVRLLNHLPPPSNRGWGRSRFWVVIHSNRFGVEFLFTIRRELCVCVFLRFCLE